MKRIRSTATIFVLGLAATASASTWTFDPMHTRAEFTVRHMGLSNVRGDFAKLTGTITIDDKDISQSTVEATIDVASIDTRVAYRDDDLKGEDYFDVAKFPAITFKSKKVEKSGEAGLKVTGDLTMHGVTKEVVLDVDELTAEMTDKRGTAKRGVTATTKLLRSDYGMKSGIPMIGDEIKISLDMELVKKEAPAAAPAAAPAK